ncbi:MAG TPA: VWA domain-containing protein [Pyrinomonadaceae bacterium]|nr:VWA domain-containing protein [Pyrinomonadaceae bacterium]
MSKAVTSSVPRSFKKMLVGLSVSILLFVAVVPFNAQQNQQRPRRVTDSQDQTSTTPKAPSSAIEEVDEGDVVRVETQLVSVSAVVTNNSGRPLTGLRRENFVLFEDGKPQTIANFETTEAPFEIALLLDTSGSTRADVALIRQAANAFINSLRSGDRVAIVAFNTAREGSSAIARVEVLSRLTEDRKSLQRAIEGIGSSNGTPFYDALQRIVSDVFREPPAEELSGRRAIVALTDGVDSTSASDFGSARARLSAAGVATYFIQVNTEEFVENRILRDCEEDGRLSLSPKQVERYRQIFVPGSKPDHFVDFCQMGSFERMQISRDLYNLARREMDALAKESGGRNFNAASLHDARRAFAQVANEIGTQYSLGYYPSNRARDGKFRTIRVEVRGTPGTPQVRAREGYHAPRG